MIPTQRNYANTLPYSILFNPDNAVIDHNLLHEHNRAFISAEPGAGRRSVSVYFEDEQGSFQIIGGWRQAIPESIPGILVLYLHVPIYRYDVIRCLLL